MKQEQHLYIHIPFCRQKCTYCAFYSIANTSLIQDYVEGLIQELRSLKINSFSTIYIGGGTPSLLSPGDLQKIFTALPPAQEITIECNPESVSAAKLQAYQEVGVNRISLGLQAGQNRILKLMNRPHTLLEFLKAYELCTQFFKNINIDTIFGYPTQTVSDWQETLDQVIGLKPTHISCYSLEIHTPRVLPGDESIDRAMYSMAKQQLKAAGYLHYEMSNFAKPGFACQHNLGFWNHQEYLGCGAAAHSFFKNTHYHHPENLMAYIKNPLQTVIDQNIPEKSEWLVKRLRLTAGFSLTAYQAAFQTDFLDDFKEAITTLMSHRLILINNGNVHCTAKGFDLYNQVILNF